MFWFNTMFPFVNFGKMTSEKLSKYENMLEFQNVFCNLVNLCLDRFHFDGLPDTCNERFFKLSLIFSGQAVLAKDEEMGFITLHCATEGSQYNIYGEVSKVIAYGWNGFNKTYTNYMYGSDNKEANAIVCRDNDTLYPLVNYIIIAAERLSATMRTLDITAKKLKTPYFIVCDEAQKNSVKKILEDIDFNKDSIITNKTTMPDMFKVLPTNVREGALQTLWDHYYNVLGEVRTIIGIPGVPNRGKRERLLTSEAEGDVNIASCNLSYRMHNYEKFCETANKHFGLQLSVRFEEGNEYAIFGLPEEEIQDNMGDGEGEVQE